MPIQVQCVHCGESYSIQRQLLGKDARCAACGRMFTMGAKADSAPQAQPADEHELPYESPASAPPPTGDVPLYAARSERTHLPPVNEEMPPWAFLLGIAAALLAVGLTLALKDAPARALVLRLVGYAGWALLAGGWAWLLVRAFRDDTLQGLMNLVPIYLPYYLYLRWRYVKRPFALMLAAGIVFLGLQVAAVAEPMLADVLAKPAAEPPPPAARPPVAVAPVVEPPAADEPPPVPFEPPAEPPQPPALPPLPAATLKLASDDMKAIGEALGRYRAEHGATAPSLAALVEAGYLSADALRSRSDAAVEIRYLTDPRIDADPANLRVYDPAPHETGQVVALDAAGRVVLVSSPAELVHALAEQQERLAALRAAGRPYPRLAPPDAAPNLVAQYRLRDLADALADYAGDHAGRYPAKLDDLHAEGYLPSASLQSASPGGGGLAYVTGLSADSPETSIIVYDPAPYANEAGRTEVYALNLAGTISSYLSVGYLNTLLRSQGATVIAAAPASAPTDTAQPPAVELAVRDRWDVEGWTDAALDADHLLYKTCGLAKQFTVDRSSALAGVGFGPAAKSKADPAYAAYRRTMEEALAEATAKEADLTGRVEQKLTVGGTEYDRIVVGVGGKVATVLLGVQDGRCVSYWFLGSGRCFPAFLAQVGKARPAGMK